MKRPSEIAREIDLFFFRNLEIPMWEVRLLLLFNRNPQMEEFGL